MKSSASVVLLVAACLAGCSDRPGPKAVYLVQGQGELTADDLKAHPEVVVVNAFEEFRRRAGRKAALWIDKNAIGLVDINWLCAKPQKWYPVALVGCKNSDYAYRECLDLFNMLGPPVDWTKQSMGPGFSVGILLSETAYGHCASAWTKGYPGKPTVEAILKVTSALLEGRRDEVINPPGQPGPRP